MAASEAPVDVGDENGNPWTPLKDLAAVVDAAVLRHQPGLQVSQQVPFQIPVPGASTVVIKKSLRSYRNNVPSFLGIGLFLANVCYVMTFKKQCPVSPNAFPA